MPVPSPSRRSPGRRSIVPRARHLVSTLLVLVVLVAGCSGGEEEPSGGGGGGEDGPPEEPVTIRLNMGTPGQEVFYLMQQMPEVAPNLGTWYEIEWSQMGAAQAAQGIASDAVDGGVIATLAAANLIEQGVDLVLTGELIEEREPNTPMSWLVTNDSGITSVADLAGKTVGTIGIGTFADHVADYYIRAEGGLEPDQDYQKTTVAFPIMQDALLSGQIATGPFPPPFLQQTLATGKVRPLFVTHDVLPQLVVTVNVFRRGFVEEHRTAVEKFVEDWVTVNQWMLDPANRQQVLEATNAVTEIPIEVLDRYLLTEEDGYRPPNGAIDQEALQATWDFFREQGAFETDLQVEDYVIPELLPPPA